MDWSSVPDFLRPRLRLFLSVDLVGSTALKQSGEFPIKKPDGEESLGRVGAKWLLDLATFYRDIEAKFTREWDLYSKQIAPKCKWPTTVSPRLWKVNGDELIY